MYNENLVSVNSYTRLKNYFLNLVKITPDEWEVFESGLHIRTFKKGDTLLQGGQTCKFVAFINTGSVRAYEIIDGIESNRTFFSEGFFATEYKSFISQEPSEEYLEVLEDSELIWITYPLLQSMFDRFKSFERLGRLISEMLYIKMRNKIKVVRVNTPEERYRTMIQDNPEFLNKIQHYHLASYLGIAPQSLSRIRKRLKPEFV